MRIPATLDESSWGSGGKGPAERYRTLLEINNAIISNLTQDALFRAISQSLRRVVPFDRNAIFLYDPEKDMLRLYAMESSTPSQHFVVGLEMAPGASHIGWVFRNRRPLLRRNLAVEKEYPTEDSLYAEGFQSLVVVPMIVRGKCIGTLNIAGTKSDLYSRDDADFLQEVANQIALAVQNMNAYEEIASLNFRAAEAAQRYRALLEINNAIITNLTRDTLLHAICEALKRVVPFDRAALTLYEPERDILRILALEGRFYSDVFHVGFELPRKDSHAGWAFDHQRPLLRRDLEKEVQYGPEKLLHAEGIRSLCTAPLIVRGKSIGTLNVASNTRNQYDETTAAFLQEAANQVALAVENMKAYEEIAGLKARLEKENIYLQEEIRREHNFEEVVGNSPAILDVLRKVETVANTDTTILIYGETGTGKELIARAIHDRSIRRDRPLVKVNCTAIPAGLVESELFGHVKGAFTGALERRVGRFELADGGTIFLDEIGELPLDTQVKLLRVLQEQEFEPVGSSRTIRVSVRIIAATNRDLEEAVREGRFRADLFYRLNVLTLRVPPLRERPGDIPLLAMFFLDRFAKKFGKQIEAVSKESMDRLVEYSWPGNIRELQNVIERGVVLCSGELLTMDAELFPLPANPGSIRPTVENSGIAARSTNLPLPPAPQPSPEPPPASDSLDEVEKRHILAVLERTKGKVEGPHGAATILNMNPSTLRSRMRKLGIPARGRAISR
jgi:formate hydrogenlyase transcriptional activator